MIITEAKPQSPPRGAWTYPILVQGVGTSKIYLFTDCNTCTIVADPTNPENIGKHYTKANINAVAYEYFDGTVTMHNNT